MMSHFIENFSFDIIYNLFCLTQNMGRIPLSEATLIEDPNEQFQFVVDDGGMFAFF